MGQDRLTIQPLEAQPDEPFGDQSSQNNSEQWVHVLVRRANGSRSRSVEKPSEFKMDVGQPSSDFVQDTILLVRTCSFESNAEPQVCAGIVPRHTRDQL